MPTAKLTAGRMARLHKALGVLLASAAHLGCGGSVTEVANTSRAAATWEPGKPGDHKRRLCLEYSTAVAQTGKHKLDISVPVQAPGGATVSPAVAIDRDVNISQIYTVSETLQLGHAALYRLCEARGNDDISPAEYREMFSDVFEQVRDLIAVQVDVRHHGLVTERVRLMQEREQEEVLLRDLENAYAASVRLLVAGCGSSADAESLVTQYLPERHYAGLPPQVDKLITELERLGSDSFGAGTAATTQKDACVTAVRSWRTKGRQLIDDIERKHTKVARLLDQVYGVDAALSHLFATKSKPERADSEEPPVTPGEPKIPKVAAPEGQMPPSDPSASAEPASP